MVSDRYGKKRGTNPDWHSTFFENSQQVSSHQLFELVPVERVKRKILREIDNSARSSLNLPERQFMSSTLDKRRILILKYDLIYNRRYLHEI